MNDPKDLEDRPGGGDADAGVEDSTEDDGPRSGAGGSGGRIETDGHDAGRSAPRDRHQAVRVRHWLETVRGDPRRRLPGFTVAGLVGIGLAGVHWVGLIVGGALVGAFGRDIREAVAAGAGYGAVTWLFFLGATWLTGNATAVVETGRIAVLSALVTTSLGGFGALARGLVPSRRE